ncbi:hypothetical protein MTBGP_11660 [Moorella thermoacetica]
MKFKRGGECGSRVLRAVNTMHKLARKMTKRLALILVIVAFIFFPAINVPIAYADYYQAYTGTGSIWFSIQWSNGPVYYPSWSTPNPNPLYVPGNMGAGLIKVTLRPTYSSTSYSFYHGTMTTIPLYAVDSAGNQTLVANLTFTDCPPVGNNISFGPYYLNQNYRGFKLGSPSAYCPSGYTMGSASLNAYLDFEFYAIVFASTESQFTTLSNNAASAATNAQNAYNAANTAASAAQSAQSAANSANTNAQNAYNAANAAKASADQAAANTTYSGQSAAYWAYLAAQGGTDTAPPTIQKVAGQNGATCTSTGTFYVVVQATDNRAGQLQAHAQVDGGVWTGWYNIPQNAIPVSLSSVGAHTITVEVKDAAGNSSQATMTAFRV